MFKDTRWLFFDVGSTIMNEQPGYENRIRKMAELAGVSYEEVYEMVLAYYRQNKKGDHEAARALGVELPRWNKEDEVLYDDALCSLAALSQKYKIGVIANQSPGTRERLEKCGILKYIDEVVASAEEGVAKPDRRIFELALERSGCKPANGVMIGDRLDNDIAPANLIGMKTVWIKQGFGRYQTVRQEHEKPDLTVNSLTELCGILLRR